MSAVSSYSDGNVLVLAGLKKRRNEAPSTKQFFFMTSAVFFLLGLLHVCCLLDIQMNCSKICCKHSVLSVGLGPAKSVASFYMFLQMFEANTEFWRLSSVYSIGNFLPSNT